MENDMETATLFEIDVMKELDILKEKLSTKVKVESEVHNAAQSVRDVVPDTPTVAANTDSHSGGNSRYNVKLPKIEIKKFYGDPVHCPTMVKQSKLHFVKSVILIPFEPSNHALSI